MRKLLVLLGTAALSTSAILTTVACYREKPSSQPEEINSNIKNWVSVSSNVVKSIITAKDENFNTNRLVKNTLENNPSHINNMSLNDNTGESYDNFVNKWGYNNQIIGYKDTEFNSNNNLNALDNKQLKDQESFKNSLDSDTSVINRFGALLPIFLGSNSSFYNNIESFKGIIVDKLGENLDYLKVNQAKINQYLFLASGILSTLFTNLKEYNPKNDANVEKYYVEKNNEAESVQATLFGNENWLKHQENNADSVARNSEILKNKNTFTSWDQFILYRNGINFNNALYQLTKKVLGSEKATNLSTIFNNSLEWNSSQTTNFNVNSFSNSFKNIINAFSLLAQNNNYSELANTIINLVINLLPIVKYKIFNILPTQSLNAISSSDNTNIAEGKVSLETVVNKTIEILSNRNSFADFIASFILPNSDNSLKLENYFGLDITVAHDNKNYAITQVVNPIRLQIKNILASLYDNNITLFLDNYYVIDIAKQINNVLTNANKFNVKLCYLDSLNNIVFDILGFINKITSYKDKTELANNWIDFWKSFGLQDKNTKDFKENSLLQKIQALANYSSFRSDIANFASAINDIYNVTINTYIEKETTRDIDINNLENHWKVDNLNIKANYNPELDDTSINYQLTDNVTKKKYNISVVVDGNCFDNIDMQQLKIKKLQKLN